MRTGVTLWRTPRKWCTLCTPSLGEWIVAGNSPQALYCFFLNHRGVASYVKSQHYSVMVLMTTPDQVTFVVFRDHQQNPNSHTYLWHLCIPRPWDAHVPCPCAMPMCHAHVPRPCTTPMYHAHVPRPCTTPMYLAHVPRPCITPMYYAVVCTYCTSYLMVLRCVWVF